MVCKYRRSWLTLCAFIIALGCDDQNEASDQLNRERDAALDEMTLDQSAPVDRPVLEVQPGLSIGEARIGMTFAELKSALGEPDMQFGFRRTMNVRYTLAQLEVALITREDQRVEDDSVVVAVGTLAEVSLTDDLPLGLNVEALTARFGEPLYVNEALIYFTSAGLAVELNNMGDHAGEATRYGVWRGFESQETPPLMERALGTTREPMRNLDLSEAPRFTFEGETFEVIDAHLHTGTSERQRLSGLTFLVNQVPQPAQIYFPSSVSELLDPYHPFVGIQEHLRAAHVARGVLLATYTHHTIGYTTNRQLEALLTDPRNDNIGGLPWAWGMVSVNYDQFDDPDIASRRLEALSSYFERHPELMIGIKLAHAHQAVSFDDPIYLGVYDVAARHQKAVLLHTGFSPFPNTRSEPEYYDPASLEAVIEQYDGQHGLGRVEFVLSHIGQGDARSIEHSISLAERYDHVWLELSAINQPTRFDERGDVIEDPAPGHIYTLAKIKERGVADRLIFATDGPQYFGKSHSYLTLIAESLRDTGYSVEEMRGVFSENFYRCFKLGSR